MPATTRELTDRQNMVLSFIYDYVEDHGWPPTLREIGDYLGIGSTNGVNDHLKALERKGYLERVAGKSRAIKLPAHKAKGFRRIQTAPETVEIPILGRIAAGQPMLASENVEDTVRIDKFFVGSTSEIFALRVSGESMIEAGIHDSDFIFVKKRSTARPGDIVVALIEDEATVKRYYPEKNRIRFQPENSGMEPIYVNKGDFKQTMILGVVVGVYRKY